jgi:hypothetical protein
MRCQIFRSRPALPMSRGSSERAWNGRRAVVCLEAADGEEEEVRGARQRGGLGQAAGKKLVGSPAVNSKSS